MKNTLKQIIAGALVAGACLFPGHKAAAQESAKTSKETSGRYSLFYEGSIRFGYEAPIIFEIKNIPLEIRDLPAMPGEESYPALAPIKDDFIYPAPRISIADLCIGAQASLNKNLRLRIGAGENLNMNSEMLMTPDKRRDTKIRNAYIQTQLEPEVDVDVILAGCDAPPKPEYLNEGYVDYYRVKTNFKPFGGDLFKPYLFSEINFTQESAGENYDVSCGLKLSRQEIGIENGWTRGYRDRICLDEKLADLTILSPYISVGKIFETDWMFNQVCFVKFDAGASFPVKKEYTELGKRMDFDFSKFPFFMGLKMGCRF